MKSEEKSREADGDPPMLLLLLLPEPLDRGEKKVGDAGSSAGLLGHLHSLVGGMCSVVDDPSSTGLPAKSSKTGCDGSLESAWHREAAFQCDSGTPPATDGIRRPGRFGESRSGAGIASGHDIVLKSILSRDILSKEIVSEGVSLAWRILESNRYEGGSLGWNMHLEREQAEVGALGISVTELGGSGPGLRY